MQAEHRLRLATPRMKVFLVEPSGSKSSTSADRSQPQRRLSRTAAPAVTESLPISQLVGWFGDCESVIARVLPAHASGQGQLRETDPVTRSRRFPMWLCDADLQNQVFADAVGRRHDLDDEDRGVSAVVRVALDDAGREFQ